MSILVKQKPMRVVLIALIPSFFGSLYFFGLRSLLMMIIVVFAGFVTEYIFTRFRKEKVTEAVFVTSVLFSLTLPPALPFWIATVGIVFAVLFGKMVFGGFGKNPFNPALVGRAFIYVSFGQFMTAQWSAPFANGFGGFIHFMPDALTGATPLKLFAQGQSVDMLSLFLGNIPGSFGETSALLLLIGGVYLLVKKVANWRIVASVFASFILIQSLFWLFKLSNAVNPLSAILSGGFMLGAFFMATDPVSASQTDKGRWIYGSIIGILTVLIRTFSVWPEGFMFAVLFGNTFAPIIDYVIRENEKKKKVPV